MAVILIVEDDEAQARLLTHVLQQAGHTPMVAPSGFAALLGVRAHPDLILLDMELPDIPGEELLRRLKGQADTAHIPVVVVTEPANGGDAVPWNRVPGGTALLRKPVSATAAREVVNSVLSPPTAWGAAIDRDAHQRVALLYRLICNGSDSLVFQLCLRLEADQTPRRGTDPGEPLSWPEIVRWAKREGLLGEAEGQALLQIPTRQPLEMIA